MLLFSLLIPYWVVILQRYHIYLKYGNVARIIWHWGWIKGTNREIREFKDNH